MSDFNHITGRQLAAARVLTGISQSDLAARAHVSIATLRRMEASGGPASGIQNNVRAVRAALEAAGCIFIDENGEGPGVRLRKAPPPIATQIEALEGKIATIPDADQPSPEAAMNVMRKAVAENEIVKLRNRRQSKKGGSK